MFFPQKLLVPLMRAALVSVMAISLFGQTGTAHASAVTLTQVTTTSTASGAVATYTFFALGSIPASINSVTVQFPTRFTIPATPAVTVATPFSTCGVTGATAVASKVVIVTSGQCDSSLGLVVTVAGVRNPCVPAVYTGSGVPSATAGFAMSTSLDPVTVATVNFIIITGTSGPDTDGDGQGDTCDPDDDNDGVLDTTDNCVLVANAIQLDTDSAGMGDACDPDDDNDGVLDTTDNCQLVANADQNDIDGDRQGDACEPFSYPAGGVFVIGDLTPHSAGTAVTFWGAQWAKKNTLSGGDASSAFKGFENSNGTPTCGGTWASRPGNSSGPPASLSPYMAVVVSSKVAKSGSIISGDIRQVVIVYTAPGYGPSPGQPGTGTVVRVLCNAL